MPAFKAEVGMPYWVDLMSSEPRKSRHFYTELLGWEFRDRLARVEGLPVAGVIEATGNTPDTWVTYFYAPDLSGTVARAQELGARVLAESTTEIGDIAILSDPAGALLGLINPAGEGAFVAAGEPGTAVWHELTATTKYTEAADFYRELFGWATQEGDRYTVILQDGGAFAGIADARGQFPPQVPSFWQSYLGVADVDAAVATVPGLGGEIIREPWDADFGRIAIVADSTGATITLAQVDPYVEETVEEGDDILQVLKDAGIA